MRKRKVKKVTERNLMKEFDNLVTILLKKKVIGTDEINSIYGFKETNEFTKIKEHISSIVNNS